MSHKDPSTFNIRTDIPSLKGKIIFVTGGTAGIGEESIKHLVTQSPAHVYFTGRNRNAANSLIDTIQASQPGIPLTFIEMDMSSLSSIAEAMKPFTSSSSPQHISKVDIIIASAGVMATPSLKPWTKDGFEAHFGINHLGNALIIKHLLPALLSAAAIPKADVRVVLLTSLGWKGHPSAGINFPVLRKTPEEQGCDMRVGNLSNLVRDLLNYGQSKLANILYAKELARRYGDQGITAVAVHPGVVSTSLVGGLSWSWSWLVKVTNWNSMVSPEEGVRNDLWAAFGDGVENGKWYRPVGQVGEEKGTKLEDQELAAKLWDWTDQVFEDEKVL